MCSDCRNGDLISAASTVRERKWGAWHWWRLTSSNSRNCPVRPIAMQYSRAFSSFYRSHFALETLCHVLVRLVFVRLTVR